VYVSLRILELYLSRIGHHVKLFYTNRMPLTRMNVRENERRIELRGDRGVGITLNFMNSELQYTPGDMEDAFTFTNPDGILYINKVAGILTVVYPNFRLVDLCREFSIQELSRVLQSFAGGNLDISAAPHIGVLIEGDDIEINDMNGISLTNFEDGEECVLIRHPNGNFTVNGQKCFVYHIDSLQGWFDSGRKTEPRTSITLTQDMLQRFNYAKPARAATSAAAARKARKSRKSRKTRRSRK